MIIKRKNRKAKPSEAENQPPFDDIVSALFQVPKENIEKPKKKEKKLKTNR